MPPKRPDTVPMCSVRGPAQMMLGLMRITHRLVPIVLTGLLVLVAGCQPVDTAPDGAASADPSIARLLDELTVAAWHSMAGYSRDRFPHWVGQGNGCDTRDVVLQRDGTGVTVADHCAITGGRWTSPYDGMTVTDPEQLDIDHLVPLADAWRTGADRWTDQRRSQFANDLTRPQLLAVTRTTNRAKGDQDPAHWKPPNREFWCVYAKRWVTVKAYWQLSVTAAEKAALLDMMGTCR
jgi:Protein of unknown function (DUF1524)